MFIELDFQSDIPIYEQLKTEIIVGIASGQLTPGERLPSVRQMASDIGINLHTVNKAYTQLKEEGYLLIHRQRGVVVNPEGPEAMTKERQAQLRQILRPLIADSLCRQMTEKELTTFIQSIYDELKEDRSK